MKHKFSTSIISTCKNNKINTYSSISIITLYIVQKIQILRNNYTNIENINKKLKRENTYKYIESSVINMFTNDGDNNAL